MYRHLFFLPVLIVLLLPACSYKGVPYFQDLNQSSPSKETIANFSPVTIQPEDVLGINVSSLNTEASSVFNYNLNTVTGTTQNANNPVVGYLVDEKGDIQLPLVGSVKVSGLTLSAVREKIQRQLTEYLKQPVVNVRLLNFKVYNAYKKQRPVIKISGNAFSETARSVLFLLLYKARQRGVFVIHRVIFACLNGLTE